MTEKKNHRTTTNRRKRNRQANATKAGSLRMALLCTGVAVVLFIVLILHGHGNNGSVLKPLIDVPLTEEETEEVVYTQGVDVSNYQGEIDWPTLQAQGIQFAYIKATEGNAWVDQRFAENWEGASSCDGLRYGAYHFMSFRTPGKEQAANFINTVPKDKHALPPVVDIELYDEFINDPPTSQYFWDTLNPILNALEEKYGKQPVIYTTTYIYERYLQGIYDNPIWIADHSLPATLPDGTRWTFCQYSYEGQLDGYDGEEIYIDLDVFNGTVEELQEL